VRRRTILLAVAGVGLAGCGSGDRSQRSHAPVTPAERAGVADFKYCLEGASVLTAAPGKTIPELGKAPAGQDAQGAKWVLSAGWRFTKHSANIYYGDSEGAAANAAGGLGKGAQQKSRLVIAPSEGSTLSSDEAQLVSDCLL
jgi:hypothetical protein